MDKLVVSIYDSIDYNKESLHVTFDLLKREWKFVSEEYELINNIYDKQSTTYHILNFIRSDLLHLHKNFASFT